MPAAAARAWVVRARAAPERTALLTDFDGTLAEIVTDPAAARPLHGVVDLLEQLGRTYATVAVISGRPVAFLQTWFPRDVTLSGLYGLEQVRGGVQVDHPDAEPWRTVVDGVVARARTALPAEVDLEPKGLSVTAHYRAAPAHHDAVVRWAEAESARTGLLARGAKRSVELHPPVDADKGTALEALAGDAAHVCFVGDDLGDLPAFAALSALSERGVDVLRVAVRSAELAPEVAAVADAVVDGPAGAVELFRSLRPSETGRP